jgi:uncharacterized RDD family membrane protein YckC
LKSSSLFLNSFVWRNLIDDQLPQPSKSSSLLRRLAALIYDSFLLIAITFGYGILLLLIKIIFNGLSNLENIQPGPLLQWLSFGGWLGCLFSYYYVCWRKQGQTLGMKAWRLKLQQQNGDLASPKQCLIRGVSAPLSMACVGLGYLWILLPTAKGCLHDALSETEVIIIKEQK